METPTYTVKELETTIEIWEDKGIYAAMDYFYGINTDPQENIKK